MKRFGCFVIAAALCLGLTGCDLPVPEKKLSDEEVVNAFIAAYQQGDYEGIKPYIEQDNQLHSMFAALKKENASGMDAVYQKVHQRTSDLTATAAAIEGMETWGEVSVKITHKDFTLPIQEAMDAAIQEQTKNGGDAFSDLPAWLSSGLDSEEGGAEEEITVYVGAKDEETVLSTSLNQKFFAAISGGFYDYINSTMTVCSMTNGGSMQIAAKGDYVVGMLQSEAVEQPPAVEGDAGYDAYLASFPEIQGVTYGIQPADEGAIFQLGINLETANTTLLHKYGIISGKVGNTSGTYLSLRSTLSGFEKSGATYETIIDGTVKEESAK